jgi:hypothetical protein
MRYFMGNMKAIHLAEMPSAPEDTRLMQAEVNLRLFKVAEKILKKRKLKIRQIMEWSLKSFILTEDPEEARRLGIIPDK